MEKRFGSIDADSQSAKARRWLGDYLVAAGKLTQENVARALRLQEEHEQHERIGEILVKLGLVSERDVAESLAQQFSLRFVSKAGMPDKRSHSTDISQNFLRYSTCLVLDEDESRLTLVMADPGDRYVIDAVSLASGKEVVSCVGAPSDIESALEEIFDSAADDVPASMRVQFRDDVEHLAELAGEAPVIRLVNQIIAQAAESGASDIHIEPFEGHLKIRYRIDGLLREMDTKTTQSSAAVISRVKIMASLNIAERRLAQDGRFKHEVRGVTYDFRVSTVPTMYGESVVMRLLQRDQAALDFDDLGFTPEQTDMMRTALQEPHGIILVTGPTGSGKSTTLYAALRHLNSPERMIITVEDPVEYNIEGINQIAVKPKIGLTFANALRSILRQDPDVIMVGEMRDPETAQISVQAALTGHLVLSTLHTNDAPSSIIRMLDIGVQDYLLTSAVNLVQAQRLVRRLCQSCCQPYTADREIFAYWGLLEETVAGVDQQILFRSKGCGECDGTGYSGRMAIVEMFRVTDSIRKCVLSRDDAAEIRRQAISAGMIPMRDDGYRKALAGLTTIEEVFRVTPESSR